MNSILGILVSTPFQFLIGRLKTHKDKIVDTDPLMFQFLIGRLKTRLMLRLRREA